MPTTKEAVAAIVRRIGFDEGRVRAVARVLTDATLLPPGSPGKSPELDADHVVSLIIGAAVDAPLRAIADTVAAYRALTPGGVDLTGAPASIDTAGQALDILADIAIHGEHPDLCRRDFVEVVATWPEIVIGNGTTGAVTRFVPTGTDAGHWQHTGNRRSTTINASAFIDAVRDIFGEQA